MMTFTHSHQDLKGNITSSIEYTVHEEGDIDDVMQEFRLFLLAVSFQPTTVDKYIKSE